MQDQENSYAIFSAEINQIEEPGILPTLPLLSLKSLFKEHRPGPVVYRETIDMHSLLIYPNII